MLEGHATEARELRFGASFLLPIGALVGLALVISGLFVWYSAHEQDRQSRDSSVVAMAEYLKSRSRTIARVARDYAWWNDAVRYMQMEIDLDWADRILGRYVYSTFEFVELVVDPSGRTVYAAVDGKRVNAKAKSPIRHGLPELIHRALVGWNKGPEPASGLIDLDGHVAIAAICALTPESNEGVEAPAGERNLILFAKRLDASYLGDAVPMLRVADLKIVAPETARPQTAAALPLLAADGHHLADLVWNPARPGSTTLSHISRSSDSRSRRCFWGLSGVRLCQARQRCAASERGPLP